MNWEIITPLKLNQMGVITKGDKLEVLIQTDKLEHAIAISKVIGELWKEKCYRENDETKLTLEQERALPVVRKVQY